MLNKESLVQLGCKYIDDRPSSTAVLWLVRDTSEPGEPLRVLKEFINEDPETQSQNDARLLKAVELQGRNIHAHASVVRVDLNRRFIVTEAVLHDRTWAPNLKDLVEGNQKHRLGFAEAWAILRHLADTVKEFQGVGGHGDLSPDNVLFANPSEPEPTVIDSLDPSDAAVSSDLEGLGRLFLYVLSRDPTVCEEQQAAVWSWYERDGVERLRKIQRLTRSQEQFVESLIRGTLGQKGERFPDVDALLRHLRSATDIQPVPPLYSYGLLAACFVGLFPIFLFLANVFWQMLFANSSPLPPTPTATLAPPYTLVPSASAPTDTEVRSPKAPEHAVVSASTTTTSPARAILTITYSPGPTLPLVPYSTPTTPPVLSPTAAWTSRPPSSPTPLLSLTRSLTPRPAVRLRALPGHLPDVREACDSSSRVVGTMGTERGQDAIAMLELPAGLITASLGCVDVWTQIVGNMGQGHRGFVRSGEVCILPEDYDSGPSLLGEALWAQLRAYLQRCP